MRIKLSIEVFFQVWNTNSSMFACTLNWFLISLDIAGSSMICFLVCCKKAIDSAVLPRIRKQSNSACFNARKPWTKFKRPVIRRQTRYPDINHNVFSTSTSDKRKAAWNAAFVPYLYYNTISGVCQAILQQLCLLIFRVQPLLEVVRLNVRPCES